MSEVKDVRGTLGVLRELQAVDARLAGMHQQMANMANAANEHKRRVDELNRELEEERKNFKSLEKGALERELQIKVQQQKVEKFRTQLNGAKTQKEYNALLHEISAAEAEASKAEDEALQMMSKVDELRIGMQKTQQSIEEANRDTVRRQQEMEAEMRQASSEMRQLMAERTALHGRLEKEVARQYERILQGRQGQAVVPVVDQICTGCHMGITKQVLTRLMATRELVYCPNCSRFIYLEMSE